MLSFIIISACIISTINLVVIKHQVDVKFQEATNKSWCHFCISFWLGLILTCTYAWALMDFNIIEVIIAILAIPSITMVLTTNAYFKD